MDNDNSYSIAGISAGAAGLLTFLVLHHLWITPIWFILPLGLVVATVGGLAVGWSYAELHHRLPERPWKILVFTVLIITILLPSLALGQLRRPMFDVSPAGGANLAMAVPEVVFRFIAELLLTATATGALLGWWLGRTSRAAIATAVAGLVFALGPGHNIPFIGSTPGVHKQIRIIAAVIFLSAIVLVEVQAWKQGAGPGIGRDEDG